MTSTSYVERRSALRWPLVVWGLSLPAGLAAAVVATVMFGRSNGALAVIVFPSLGVGLVAAMVGSSLLYRNWPTGIRIDDHGITIGAVGSRHAAMRRPTVTHQNWGLFSCPWTEIREVTVVTDPWKIHQIKKSPQYWTLSNHWAKPREMNRCQAGVLTAPFMKAALLINVGYGGGSGPELSSTMFFSNYIAAPRFSMELRAEPSAEWIVPTRKPDELQSFFAGLPPARKIAEPEDR